MGFWDTVKQKIASIGGGSESQSQQHWDQYQKFRDAKNSVLKGDVKGEPEHIELNQQRAVRIASAKQNDKSRNFPQISAGMRVAELSTLEKDDPEKYQSLRGQLEGMKTALEEDYTQENYDARAKALEAEFVEKLGEDLGKETYQKYEDYMTKTDSKAIEEEFQNYNTISQFSTAVNPSNIRHAESYGKSIAEKRLANNNLLEKKFGLEEGSLGDSIVGDSAVVYVNSEYYRGRETVMNFRDGNPEMENGGSHLQMVGNAIEIMDGEDKFAAQYMSRVGDMTLNEYQGLSQEKRLEMEGKGRSETDPDFTQEQGREDREDEYALA